MSKKITKNIKVIEALNEVAWYEQKKDQVDALSATARLALKRNMKKLQEISKDFYELRDELDKEIREKYGTDEKSEETEIEGNDGTKQPGRKVKDEYLEEFQKEQQEMQDKLNKLITDTEDVELIVINLDAEVERADEKDIEIKDSVLDMLSLFEDEGE